MSRPPSTPKSAPKGPVLSARCAPYQGAQRASDLLQGDKRVTHNTKKYANSGPSWVDVAYAIEAFERKWGRHAEFKMVGQVSGRRATGRLVVSVWTQKEAHRPYESADKRYESEVYAWGKGDATGALPTAPHTTGACFGGGSAVTRANATIRAVGLM